MENSKATISTPANTSDPFYWANGVGGTITITSMQPPSEEKLEPEKIIYHGRTTIVYWNDGTKTISTCDVNDQYSEYLGFSSCLMKKMYGKKVYGKPLHERMIKRAERHF